jgi:hypothetical protein
MAFYKLSAVLLLGALCGEHCLSQRQVSVNQAAAP